MNRESSALETLAGSILFPYLRALAHEMASPVTQILGYTQMVQEMLPDGIDCQDDLQHVEHAAGEARDLIGTLSRMARREVTNRRCHLADLWIDISRLARIVSFRNSSQLHCTAQSSFEGVDVAGNPWLLRAGLLAVIGASFASPNAELTLEGTEDSAIWTVRAESFHRDCGPPLPERPHALEFGLELLRAEGAEIEQSDTVVSVSLKLLAH